MRRGWPLAVLLALCACGGSGTAPIVQQPPAPTPSPPSLAVLGYAVQSGGRSDPRVLTEYPMASTVPTRSFTEPGGANIRFDPSGTLWSDTIGLYVGYRPDGSRAGTINLPGTLRAFDVHGNLYEATCCSLDVVAVRSDNSTVLERSISTTAFACSAAADAAGDVFIATCAAGPFLTSLWNGVSMYGPAATGKATPVATNVIATGPLAVDRAGNLYAPYGDAVGVWAAGAFGSVTPARTLPLPSGVQVIDIALDRAGNAYVLTRPSSSGFSFTSALLYFSGGTGSPVTLQSGSIGGVTTVP